jgi:transposase
MRLPGSAKVLEARRRRALALVEKGFSFNQVARRLGCAASSVMRWARAVERHGPSGLEVRRAPGRPPRLTKRQRDSLLRQLLRGAMALGYPTDLWTTKRIAEVIERRYGVRYHRDHVGRLLGQWGWSCQKPERRARERDEAAIERWKRVRWPQVKKTRFGWAPTSSSSTNRASG